MTAQKYLNSKTIPALTLLVLAAVWGSSFILIKKGLDSFNPVQVGCIRIVFAYLVLLPFALQNLKSVYWQNWKKIFLLGIIANLVPAILFAAAETEITSSLAGILNSLTTIFTMLAGVFIFGTAMRLNQITGLIIGLTGSVTLGFVGGNGELGQFNFYALFIVAATILYGINGNMVKVYFMKIPSLVLTALAIFSVGPIALIYLISSDFISIIYQNQGAWSSLGYLFLLGAVGTAFALILFNKLIQNTSAIFASTVTYLIPIIAVIWGVVDGEKLFLIHFTGMALIIGGVYLINKNK
jgi:drug/metabolite transporter (DMT)-like permease